MHEQEVLLRREHSGRLEPESIRRTGDESVFHGSSCGAQTAWCVIGCDYKQILWGSNMNQRVRILIDTVSLSIGILSAASAGAAEGDSLEQVVVTGTRVANRSALDTAAPVDVVSNDALQHLGSTEVN